MASDMQQIPQMSQQEPLVQFDLKARKKQAAAQLKVLDPLTGLRGVCALLIVVGHFFTNFAPRSVAAWPAFPVEYFSPVTLFFLLSGVVLSYCYDESEDAGGWSSAKKRDFWVKRFARIAPMYYVALILSLAPFLRYTHGLATLLENFILAPLFLQGLTLIGNDWAGHLWQVSAFMLCYLLYPWLIARLRMPPLSDAYTALSQRGSHRRRLLFICLVCYVLPLCIMGLAFGLAWPLGLIHTWFLTRFPQFVIGVALGLFLVDSKNALSTAVDTDNTLESVSDDNRSHSSGLVGCSHVVLADFLTLLLACHFVLCTLLSFELPNGTKVWWIYMLWSEFAILPLHCAWIYCMVRAGIDKAGMNKTGIDKARRSITCTVMESEGFLMLGKISYSLYCIHYPLFYLLSWLKVNGKPDQSNRDRHVLMGLDSNVEGPYCFDNWELLPLMGLLIVLAQMAERYIEAPSRNAIIGVWSRRCA